MMWRPQARPLCRRSTPAHSPHPPRPAASPAIDQRKRTRAAPEGHHRTDRERDPQTGGRAAAGVSTVPPPGQRCLCSCRAQLSHGCRFTPTVDVPCPSVKGSVSQGEGPTRGAGSVNIRRLATDDAPTSGSAAPGALSGHPDTLVRELQRTLASIVVAALSSHCAAVQQSGGERVRGVNRRCFRTPCARSLLRCRSRVHR